MEDLLALVLKHLVGPCLHLKKGRGDPVRWGISLKIQGRHLDAGECNSKVGGSFEIAKDVFSSIEVARRWS